MRSFVKITVLLGIVGVGVWVLFEAQRNLSQSGALVANSTEPDIEVSTDVPQDKSSEPEPPDFASTEKSEQSPFDESSDQLGPSPFSTENEPVANRTSQTAGDPFFVDNAEIPEERPTRESGGLDFRDEHSRKMEVADVPRAVGNSSPFGAANEAKQPQPDFPDAEEPSSATPGMLILPKTVDSIAPTGDGPQLFAGEAKKSGQPIVKEDPFGAEPLPASTAKEPVANKEIQAQEDPFGGFEEQTATPPRKLPVVTSSEPDPLPAFPEMNDDKSRLTPAPVAEREQPAIDGTVVIKKRGTTDAIRRSAFAEEADSPKSKATPDFAPDPLVLEHSKTKKTLPSVEEKFRGTGTIDKQVPRGENSPRLTIEKIAPENAVLGQPMIYKIIVRNQGKSKANKVVIEDRIPKGTDLDGTIPRAELTNKKLVWKLGSLEPGEEQTIRVRVIPRSAGQIGSIATVNFVSEIAAQTNIVAPDLKLELVGPRSTTLGEAVVFQFRVTNTGNADAQQVVIRSLLPKGLRHPDGDDLEYEVGTLPAGKSQEIKLAMTAVIEGQIENKAIVTASGGFRDEATSLLQVDGPILKIAHTGPKRRYIGRTASFKNDISNESKKTITLATVTETVPHEYKFLRASGGGVFNEQSRVVTWQIAQLEPGQSKRLEVQLLCKAPGATESNVTASVNNIIRAEVGSETLVEGYPKLQTVVVGADEPVAVDEQVTYRVQIKNKGTADAEDVKIAISVPSQLQFLSVQGAKATAREGNQIVFSPIASISSKGDTTISVTFKAVAEGKGSIGVHAKGNHMSRAITHEEEVIVYGN